MPSAPACDRISELGKRIAGAQSKVITVDHIARVGSPLAEPDKLLRGADSPGGGRSPVRRRLGP